MPNGYDFNPKVGGGKYLTLKSKGDIADIRIVSTPLHKSVHWITTDEGKTSQVDCIGENCVRCDEAKEFKDPEAVKRAAAKELFGWLVLDRNDDNTPKIFKGGTQIYLAIKKLLETKAWGDPQGYDIEIERTEEMPTYYRVTPLPDKGVITAEEKKAIEASDLNLEAEMVGGEVTDSFGKDDSEKVAADLEKGIEDG